MDKEFKLPDPGEGIHEAEVVEIPISEGDEVEEGQTVIVVETDKAANEVPSPYTGTIKEIKVEEGQMVRVGEVVMIFSVEDEAAGKEEKTRSEEEPTEEEAREEGLRKNRQKSRKQPKRPKRRKSRKKRKQRKSRKRRRVAGKRGRLRFRLHRLLGALPGSWMLIWQRFPAAVRMAG